MFLCCFALARLRLVCEVYIARNYENMGFVDVQDKQFIKDFIKACRCAWLWRWIVKSLKYIYNPLEHVRRWGLACPCCKNDPEDDRKTRRKKKCRWSGRRIHEAWDFICKMVVSFKETESMLTPRDV